MFIFIWTVIKVTLNLVDIVKKGETTPLYDFGLNVTETINQGKRGPSIICSKRTLEDKQGG
jgi:hypothetical protein